MKKRSLLKAAAAVMTTLAMAVMTVAPAFAVTETPNGKIVINPGEGQSADPVNRFKAYQIFKGTPSDGGRLSDIEWGAAISNTDGDAQEFVGALQSSTEVLRSGETLGVAFGGAYTQYQSTYAGQMTQAEFVANWLGEEEFDRNSGIPEAFAREAAKKVTGGTESTAGSEGDEGKWVIDKLDAGYYLVTDTLQTSAGGEDPTAVSSYILQVLGTEEVDMKASIPTVEKKVEDQKGYLAQTEQDITFTLTGTVSQNIAEFTTYKYQFVDTVSKGLTVDQESIKVELHCSAENYTWPSTFTPSDDYNVSLTGEEGNDHTLTITFDDLKKSILDAWNEQVTSNHWIVAPPLDSPYIANKITVVVTYTAHLNSDAIIDEAGNSNDVKIVYSNNPYSDGEGTTETDQVKTYTLSLKVNKVDENDTPLKEAKFKLRKSDNKNEYLEATEVAASSSHQTDYSSFKYYEVKSFTKTAEEATILSVDESGDLHIHGLEPGTYILEEVETKEGYELMQPLQFEIKANSTEGYTDGVKNDDGSLDPDITVTATKDGRQDITETSTDVDTGNAVIKITNFPAPVLPHTGGIGAGIVIAVGIVVLLIGFAAKRIISKKKIEQ